MIFLSHSTCIEHCEWRWAPAVALNTCGVCTWETVALIKFDIWNQQDAGRRIFVMNEVSDALDCLLVAGWRAALALVVIFFHTM
jgi:hypothetical protein